MHRGESRSTARMTPPRYKRCTTTQRRGGCGGMKVSSAGGRPPRPSSAARSRSDGDDRSLAEALLRQHNSGRDAGHAQLSGLRLASVDPAMLRRPWNLQSLNLSGNRLGQCEASLWVWLGSLFALESLNLADNALGGADGAALRKMTKLAELDLSRNRLSSERAILGLRGHPALTSLTLSRNQLGEAASIAAVAATLPALLRLSVGGNPCAFEPSCRHLCAARLPQLRWLDGHALTPRDRELASKWAASATAEVAAGEDGDVKAVEYDPISDTMRSPSQQHSQQQRGDGDGDGGGGSGRAAEAGEQRQATQRWERLLSARTRISQLESGVPTGGAGVTSVAELLAQYPSLARYTDSTLEGAPAAAQILELSSEALADDGSSTSFASRLRANAAREARPAPGGGGGGGGGSGAFETPTWESTKAAALAPLSEYLERALHVDRCAMTSNLSVLPAIPAVPRCC